MALKIADLLKYKRPVILVDHKNNPILQDGKPVEVWLRIIGDDDLDAAHRAARIASSEIRKAMKDTTSQIYKDRVEPIKDATREDCIEILTQYRTSNLYAEARSSVIREELVTIEEVAINPDAPTLEEQEKLDDEILKQEERYQAAMEDYVKTRTDVIVAELEGMDLETLRETTKEEISAVIALAEFFNTLMEQKVVRASYIDKTCKEKAFDSIEEFRSAESIIKEQLITAYTDLEVDPDQVKD